MNEIVSALSSFSGAKTDTETFKTLALFCSVGLTISLLFICWGLDIGVFD